MKINPDNNKKVRDFKRNFNVVYENFVDTVVEKYAYENPKKPKKHVESLRTLLLNHSELLLTLQEKIKKDQKMENIVILPDNKKNPKNINININNIETLENLFFSDESPTTVAKNTKGIVGTFSKIEIKQDLKLKEIFEILKETRENHPDFKYDIDSFEKELNSAENNAQLSSILSRITQWYNKHRDKITNVIEIFKTLLETSEYFISKIN